MERLFQEDELWYFWGRDYSEIHGPFLSKSQAMAWLRQDQEEQDDF